jgi:hypothetical protein
MVARVARSMTDYDLLKAAHDIGTSRMSLMNRWAITAGSVAELVPNFGAFGVSVSARTERKDQFAEEVYCLRRYLFPLAHSGLLEFL